jgi:hypothetical protein
MAGALYALRWRWVWIWNSRADVPVSAARMAAMLLLSTARRAMAMMVRVWHCWQ